MTDQEPLVGPEATTLVPPRPNLGPEPWPEQPANASWAGWTAGVAAILVLIVLRRRSRMRKPAIEGTADIPTTSETEVDSSHRLIATSERLREAMIQAFGTNWRSKTTEEIGREPGLPAKLEPAQVDRLIAFLKLADRLKFAAIAIDSTEEWEEWASSIIDQIVRPEPPTSSKRST